MKVGIVSDHRGLELKEALKTNFSNRFEIIDLGTHTTDAADYPNYAFLLGEKVVNGEFDFGIAICGSGIGISIACNKVKGIRCAKVSNQEEAKYTRLDNDANIIALSAKMPLKEAIQSVETFLTTTFSNEERHICRIKMITSYENGDNL